MIRRDIDVWLKALRSYVSKSINPGAAHLVRKAQLRRSGYAETNNRKSARSFCYVRLHAQPTIFYAEALTCLDVEHVVGILLHELAHIVVQSGPVDDEVDADQWVIESFPEAKYGYADAVYVSPWTSRMRTAKNLQCVSRDFIRRIV